MKQVATAIILNYTKYNDNKLIVNTYTKQLGRTTFSLNITQNKKTSPLPYCQPLFINEIEYSTPPQAEIKHATKIAPAYTYKTIPFSTNKITTAMFIAEILLKVLTFSEKNEELFNYIAKSLILFDQDEINGKNFHLKFLLQITKYLGFYPSNRYTETKPYFDLINAKFTSVANTTQQTIQPPHSKILSNILETEYIPCDAIQINGKDRSFLLEKIINYYRYHTDTLPTIKSLEVLKTVYH